MISFNKFFTLYEALRLKDVKKRRLTKKRSGAYRISKLNEVFDGKDRLVFDIDLDESDLINYHPLIEEIQNLLNKHLKGWRIESRKEYKEGIIYHFDDVHKKQGRKIGKILNSLIPKDESAERLLNAFKTDPIRSTKNKKFKVVISRHPYDIAGMSTDRNWTSCMNLGTKGVHYSPKTRGINSRYVDGDISEGSIVAYLVPGDDKNAKGKMEIRRPVARILMKPHENKNNISDIAFSMGPTYGITNDKFTKFVRNWLSTEVNKDAQGDYMLRDGLYSDNDSGVNFTIINRSKTIGTESFFETLNSRHDNEKYAQFFTFDATDPHASTSFELQITIDLPKDIKVEDFYYNDSFPPFIKDILKSEHLGADLDIRTVSSHNNSQIRIECYHYGRGEFSYEDESGNNIDLDQWVIAEQWDETFRYIDIDDIDYAKFRKEVIEILRQYDPEKTKEEERQALIEKFKQVVDPHSASGSPMLKEAVANALADRPKFYQAVEYFRSLGTPDTAEHMLEIVKTDDYRNSLKFMHDYVRLYNHLVRRLNDSVRFDKYPTLGNDANKLWAELIGEYFGVSKWLFTKNPLRHDIVYFMKMLNSYRETHTKEELDFLRDVYEDQDTAFKGKDYGLDTV